MKEYNDLTIEDIERALSFMNADCSRDDWFKMLCAVKSELLGDGIDICLDWSKTSDKFKMSDFKTAWKQADPYGKVKIGTLIFEAKKYGFSLARKRQKLSQEEIDARATKRADFKKSEELETQRKAEFRAAVSVKAAEWWSGYANAVDHPYLTRKSIKAHGTRVGNWFLYDNDLKVYSSIPNTLIIPIFNIDGFYGLQGITIEKMIIQQDSKPTDKRYMKGLGKDGLFSFFGNPVDGQKIVVCEGWATGATIHEATGFYVVVAFDAGQLRDKAQLMRDHYPNSLIIIAADNDQFTKGNPGRTIAETLKNEIFNVDYVMPEFKNLDGEPTDFNDLHVREGLDAVKSVFAIEEIKPRPMRVDFSPLPQLNSKNKPLNTIENFSVMLDRLDITPRYNVIRKDEEILIPGELFTKDNRANASLARIVSRCAEFEFPTGNVSDFLTYLADKNQFNPVVTWVESKPWDGLDHLSEFLQTVTPTDAIELSNGSMLHEILIKRWMISAVASAFSPDGVASSGVLVFQGDQGLGKTKWFKKLAPNDFGFTKDGLQLQLNDKDSVKEALSYWLVELGELDGTFNKSELSALKAFLTKDSDEIRLPYGRRSSQFARRTVFFASVNPDDFLRDATGSRRFWVIPCAKIDYQHNIDMQQVWAQVYQIWKGGETYYLSSEEMEILNEKNKDFSEIDPVSEMIDTRLEWDANKRDWKWLTATDILVSIGRFNPTKADVRQCGATMFKLNGAEKRKSNGRQLLFCPPVLDFFRQQDNQPF